MKGLVKIAWIFLFFLAGLIVSSQQPYFREIINSDNFEGGQINCIYQDKTGFIWIGTNKGPFQFDGIYYSKINNQHMIYHKCHMKY